MTVNFTSPWTIHPFFHPVSGAGLFFDGKTHLPAVAFIVVRRSRIVHALMFEGASPTIGQSPFKLQLGIAMFILPLAAQPQRFAGGTNTAPGICVEPEPADGEYLAPALRTRVTLTMLLLLFAKPLVPRTKLVVRNIAIDMLFF